MPTRRTTATAARIGVGGLDTLEHRADARVHFGRLREPTALPGLRHRDHHTRATPTDTLRRAHCPQKTGERQGSWSRETCSDNILLTAEWPAFGRLCGSHPLTPLSSWW